MHVRFRHQVMENVWECDWYFCCFWVMEYLVQFVESLNSCKMRNMRRQWINTFADFHWHAHRPQDPVRFLGRHGLSCHRPHQPTALVQVAWHAWSNWIFTLWSRVLVLPKTTAWNKACSSVTALSWNGCHSVKYHNLHTKMLVDVLSLEGVCPSWTLKIKKCITFRSLGPSS